jgi:hypothetical protein
VALAYRNELRTWKDLMLIPSEIEAEFEKQLKNLRAEVIHAVHCFSVILAFREDILPNPAAPEAIRAQGTTNFWATTLEAAETSLILTLTRVFENESANSINQIMRGIKEHHESLFSSAALTKRKLSLADPTQRKQILRFPIIPGEVPGPSLAREIADVLKEHRKHYKEQLMIVRNKWSAHREFDEDDIWGTSRRRYTRYLSQKWWVSYANSSVSCLASIGTVLLPK